MTRAGISGHSRTYQRRSGALQATGASTFPINIIYLCNTTLALPHPIILTLINNISSIVAGYPYYFCTLIPDIFRQSGAYAALFLPTGGVSTLRHGELTTINLIHQCLRNLSWVLPYSRFFLACKCTPTGCRAPGRTRARKRSRVLRNG